MPRDVVDDLASGGDDACVHELFEQQVDRTPDAIALEYRARRLTYREVDHRANQLAHHLRRLGVRPELRVGLSAEDGVETVIGMLGVLKAGGCYVPIDPEYPTERIAFLLEDAAIRIAVGRDVRISGPRSDGTRVRRVDLLSDVIAAQPERRPSSIAIPLHLAYVIYTSGSTGQPKGVEVEHRSVANLIRGAGQLEQLGPSDRALQLSSFSFDASIEEVLGPLCHGAAVLLHDERVVSPREVFDARRFREPTVLYAPTAAWHELARAVEAGEVAVPRSLRLAVIGGERVAPDRVRGWLRRTSVPVIDAYGPTEATVDATACRLEPRFASDDEPDVPIGRPLPGVRVYVLDDRLDEVPLDTPGELYIAGAGLARGYQHRPALAAERFVPDPFGPAGSRMYRSGDRASWRGDGMLRYHGRLDHQVKVRGFRVELGEIEATLVAHPAVHEAVVTVLGDHGDQRLFAYVTGASLELSQLRAYLQTQLPAFMMPSAIVVLERMPHTPAGKVDRHGLPPPVFALDEHGRVAARTRTETALAAIWQRVLNVAHVGPHDHFFRLGGNSLLVMRLVACIALELGVELTARTVFAKPTLEAQALEIDRLARSGGDEPAVEGELVAQVGALSDAEAAVQLAVWSRVELATAPGARSGELAGPRRELFERWLAQHRIDARPSAPLPRTGVTPVPATLSQRQEWAFHERGNFPQLGIQARAFSLTGPVDASALSRALALVVERQAALRSVFAIEHGQLVQHVHARGPELEIVDVRDAAGGDASVRDLMAELAQPHDLGREVFRARLVRRPDAPDLLLLVPHHIVVDGFSWDVLLGDLQAAYAAFADGRDPALAPLPFTFADFAWWQTGLADRPVGRRQLAFWADQVAGYAGLELPGDRDAPARGARGLALDTYPAAPIPFAIAGPAWRVLQERCRRLGCTPYSMLASAYALLLCRWSGREDVCMLTASFMRQRHGSELVVGDLNTAYPLRIACAGDQPLDALVRATQDRVLAVRQHAELAPSSAMSAWSEWSRYSLNFALEASAGPPAGGLGLAPVPWSLGPVTMPHDLALFVRQSAAGISGELMYNALRFSPELAARIAARLHHLVHAIAVTPEQRTSSLPREP